LTLSIFGKTKFGKHLSNNSVKISIKQSSTNLSTNFASSPSMKVYKILSELGNNLKHSKDSKNFGLYKLDKKNNK
jgi:hypothetical protein